MKRLYPLFVIFAAVLVLYHPVLATYFSQDDFFHFKVSQTDGSLSGFIKLFGFYQFEERGIAFYRPIFRETLYNTFYSLFGLNHIPFRILQFLIHFINIFLVYILIEKIFQKKYLSLFVAFFFGISSSNVATLYYLAGGIQALGATMFILLTLIIFTRYLETNNIKYAVLSFLTFLLSLGSHELAATIPVLLAGLSFAYLPLKKGVTKIRVLIPFFIILIAYLYLEIMKIGFSTQEQQYQINLNLKTLVNSLMWYSGWALGLPEMLIDFVLPGFKLNPALMRYWGNFYSVIFSAFGVIIAILTTTIIYLFTSKKFIFQNKKFLFFLVWFPLGLIPVIFLPAHKSAYYLYPVLPAFWAIIGYLILNTHLSRILVVIFCITAFVLSATSINLGHTTYWAAQRGRVAQKLINQVKSQYPTLPKGAILYIENDPNYPFVAKEWGSSSKQAAFILNNEDALRLVYKDPTLKVYYEDLIKPPNYLKDKIYKLTAKIF